MAGITRLVCIVAATGLGAGLALGHTRIKPGSSLEPRSDNSGIKSGPCGSDPQMAFEDRTVLTPGETITVEWEETIYHPGNFRWAFSPGNTNAFDDNILVDDIPSDGGPGPTLGDPASWNQFSTQITVPDVECDDCVIQLIQVMTDRNPPTLYFSCADVRIRTNPDEPLPEPDPVDEEEEEPADDTEDQLPEPELAPPPETPTNLKLRWEVKKGGDE